jgi:hypothetical protein
VGFIFIRDIDEHTEDWPTWHFDAKGLFSVKSAYKLAVARRMLRQDRMLLVL